MSGSRRPRPEVAEGLRSAGLSAGRGRDPVALGVLAPPTAPRARAGTQGFMSLCAAAVGGSGIGEVKRFRGRWGVGNKGPGG